MDKEQKNESVNFPQETETRKFFDGIFDALEDFLLRIIKGIFIYGIIRLPRSLWKFVSQLFPDAVKAVYRLFRWIIYKFFPNIIHYTYRFSRLIILTIIIALLMFWPWMAAGLTGNDELWTSIGIFWLVFVGIAGAIYGLWRFRPSKKQKAENEGNNTQNG